MENKQICEHLRLLLEALLAKGASIEGIVENDSNKVVLDVMLSQGLDPNEAMKEAKNRELTFWENNDTHYPLEYGWLCEKCLQTLSWPQSKSTINPI